MASAISLGRIALRDRLGSGPLLVAMAALGLSLKSVLAKLAYGYGAEPGMLLIMRMGFATPLLVGTMLWVHGRDAVRIPPRAAGGLVLLGLAMAGAMLTSFHGIQRVDASLATLITFTYPALTVLLMAALFRERVSRRQVVSLAVTFGGLMAVVRIDRLETVVPDRIGLALLLGAALTFAFYNAIQDRLLRVVPPLKLLGLVTVVASTIIGTQFDPAAIPRQWEVWALAAALGIVTGYLPFLAYTYGMRAIGAGRAVIIHSMAPVFTVTWAGLLLGERLGAIQFLGMGLIIAGVIAIRTPAGAAATTDRPTGPVPRRPPPRRTS